VKPTALIKNHPDLDGLPVMCQPTEYFAAAQGREPIPFDGKVYVTAWSTF